MSSLSDFRAFLTTKVARIFISYSHTDGFAVAEQLPRELSAQHDVWMDRDRLKSGTLDDWHLASAGKLCTISKRSSPLTAVAVTPDGQGDLAAAHDHTRKVWDLPLALVLSQFTADASLDAVAIAPDVRMIIAGDGMRCVPFLRSDGL